MRLVAVTACPTGIAHCWMAADRIEAVARERGHEVTVEVRSAGGVENEVTTSSVAAADVAVLAADTAAAAERFADMPTVRTSAHEAVTSTADVIDAAERAARDDGTTADQRSVRDGRDPSVESDGEPSGARLDDGDGVLARARRWFR